MLRNTDNKEKWAIEIKESFATKLEKGFHLPREDIKPNNGFVVYSGDEGYLCQKILKLLIY